MSYFKRNKIEDVTSGLVAQVSARTQTPTGNALQVQIGPGDIISNLPVIQLYDHHQVHEGETWGWDFYGSLGNAQVKDIEIIVPNIDLTGSTAVVKCPHFRWEVISSVGGDAFLYEAPTITVAGTTRTPFNFERNGSYTCKTTIKEDPTVTVAGTQIWRGLIISGKVSAGGLDTTANERVLKNNTTYLFRFTSAGATNLTLMRFMWYEDLGV